MLRRFYHSFALERERLQVPKLHRCGYLVLHLKKRLAVSTWISNVLTRTKHVTKYHSNKIKTIPLTREKVNIVECGAVAQALYRYLDAKYNFRI